MNRILLLAITTTSVMALSSACIIKTSDSTSSGNGGSSTTSTASGEGGSGAQGGGGAAGVGGMGGMGGMGGGGTCATCADFVFGDATFEELCEPSIDLVNNLGLCTCGDGMNEPGMCATQCEQSCTEEGMNADTCQPCIETNCNAELNACTADTGGM